MVSQDYDELSAGFQVMTLCIENATNGKMIYTAISQDTNSWF